MTATHEVGDLVAAFLQACEVSTAFGVISVHNTPLLDALGRRAATRFVMARGEAGAGHMADAYARVTGELGVLVTSTGPGAANATGALVEARFAGTPLLHLTGQSATPFIERGQGTVHEVPAQLEMLRAVSKRAYRVESAERALGTLTRAAVEALTPPTGPVSVEVPIDLQRAPVAELPADFAPPLPPPITPSAEQLDALAACVMGSRRPLLRCGSGARLAGDAVRRLLALDIPLVTSWNGRGVVPEDEALSLGGMNGTGTPEVEAFFATTDRMIAAGTRLRGHETREMQMQLSARIAQVDVDPAANGRTYASDLFVRADAALALDGLADRLEGRYRPEEGYAREVAALKQRALAAYTEWLGPYGSFPGDLRAALPRDGLFVRDLTMSHSTWGQRAFPVYGPRQSVYPVGAAIGPGLALGIGAAVGARGRKTVVLCGDGGFALGMAELPAAVQERADLALIVMNDGGYGVIQHIQDASFGARHYYDELFAPDLPKLCELYGMPHWRVQRADAFGPAVGAALAAEGPALVEVDMRAIGPFPRPW